MAQLTGNKKVSTAVFISGRGTNLRKLIKFSRKKNSPISINLIVSNNSHAKGLKFSKLYKIKKKVVNFKKSSLFEKKILQTLKKNKIKFICLAGFMKLLSKKFIKNFRGKIINIHPSLLPKYRGLNTHVRVIKNNEKFSGCTVHFVTSKVDSGKIILQKKVKIYKNDTPKKLSKRILFQEHKLYPVAINKIFRSNS